MFTKRLSVSLLMGAILGVFCIMGAYVRFGPESEIFLLFALWYNRLLMGLLIGLPLGKIGLPKAIVRGAILGSLVSFAYYSATGFTDHMSFVAGIVYGMIIEAVAFKLSGDEKKKTEQ
ncbi:MAG: hypothetical protein GXZ02_10355 [Clostridiales bacterium]|nr:hypothetical protein [Clostridiales bacterium]